MTTLEVFPTGRPPNRAALVELVAECVGDRANVTAHPPYLGRPCFAVNVKVGVFFGDTWLTEAADGLKGEGLRTAKRGPYLLVTAGGE